MTEANETYAAWAEPDQLLPQFWVACDTNGRMWPSANKVAFKAQAQAKAAKWMAGR